MWGNPSGFKNESLFTYFRENKVAKSQLSNSRQEGEDCELQHHQGALSAAWHTSPIRRIPGPPGLVCKKGSGGTSLRARKESSHREGLGEVCVNFAKNARLFSLIMALIFCNQIAQWLGEYALGMEKACVWILILVLSSMWLWVLWLPNLARTQSS
jgi:hypothetical protein